MNSPPDLPELAAFPVVIELPILWGDQDAIGHVNNTVPIRWFESARVVYLEKCGLSQDKCRSAIGPILASVTANFRCQLKYPDTVFVGTRVSRIGSSSIGMQHVVVNQSQGVVAVEGDSVVVTFDYSAQCPLRVPTEIRAAIKRLEGQSFS